MKSKNGKKERLFIFLALFLQIFLFSDVALAITERKEIQIPSQLGTIKEKSIENSKKTNPIIINIQDAHCNYEAQKNLAQILEYLVKKHNLKLIMVEGGNGDVNLSFLRAFAGKEDRAEVAEKYLKMGKISGEEYLDIVSDYNIDLYGIEDQALYDAHMEAFWKLDAIKTQGLNYLAGLSSAVKNLKKFMYNPELNQLEAKKKGYEEKTVPLAKYCQYLITMARNSDITVEGYLNLNSFSEADRLERETDFKEAESERNTFIKELANLLDENGVKELVGKSQEFKEEKITQQGYYSFLKMMAAQKIDIERRYPSFGSYIEYLALSKDINTDRLLKEISEIEEKIKGACFTNAEQKRLDEISKSIQIITRCLNLELTPEDYEYFQANRAEFSASLWADFLTQNSLKYNLVVRFPSASVIDDNLSQIEEFYRLGVKREEAFISNAAKKLNETGEKIAVIITGGFHTPGITQRLKNNNYPYLVVTPMVTKKGDANIYLSVLRGERNQADKTIKENR